MSKNHSRLIRSTNGIPKWKPRLVRGVAMLSCLATSTITAETLTVLNSQVGTTPTRLGYNLGHFMPDSNAADWFRYSGVDAARVFISVSEIEPSDDIAPVGDGVNSESSFFSRRTLLRTNAASTTAALSNTYVRWSNFIGNYSDVPNSGNRIQLSSALANLRDRGVAILANMTASDSRFPITGANDWAGKWELWQHYYAQAFLLSRDYGVQNFSMFNEPNLWVGMTEEDWLVRHRFCSDAIQSAVADMNSRYAKSLVPKVFAPNTANGAEKYNTLGIDEASTDTWGRDAVTNRHLQLDGTSSPSWMNLHVYNYQKYTTRTNAGSGFSGYIDDYDDLRSLVNADTLGEPSLPFALTEFNVRTAASYDTMTATQDSPTDYAALGANCIALTGRGASQLYLFKFGQTSGNNTPVYGVVKNGTHYVENDSAGDNNYGGASQCAEVYRLFNKAAKGARPRFNSTATSGASPTNTAGVWSLITYDAARGTYSAFIVNKGTAAVPLEVDFSALPLPGDNPAYVEEVSGATDGGVVRVTRLLAGKLTLADMPAQSVWLVTVPGSAENLVTRSATEDTQLGDGTSKLLTGASALNLQVRADGTANGRSVALVKIPIPGGNSPNVHSVLLQLNVATSSGTTPVKVHVYGVTNNSWQENTATWANTTAVLKQNVASGNEIQNNIVAAQGTTTQILGQLVADSPVFSEHSLDVTDFVKARSGGFASFLIVQEHRWDIAQPALTAGDTQAEGLLITSKESASGGPRLVALTADNPPMIETSPQSLTVDLGAPATFQVTATGTAPLTYQWRKNGINIPNATSNTYIVSNTAEADAGSYDVVIGNIAETIPSGVAVLTIRGVSPSINVQPQSATVNTGATVVLDVTAVGAAPLTYQWTKNGVGISGAVLRTLTLSGVTGANVGDYGVLVTNSLGSVTSSLASLAITDVALVAREAVIQGGASAASDVDEAAAGYLMVKYSTNLGSSRKCYLQFDLPTSGVNMNAAATLNLSFTQNLDQKVQVWALKQAYSAMNTAISWNTAQANDLASNDMATSGANTAITIGPPVLIDPGSTLIPYTCTLPRLGDYVFGNRVTVVLSGVDDAANSSQGLRISRGSSALKYTLAAELPWTTWKQSAFGTEAGNILVSGPSADPDRDGIQNLLEYALGGVPLTADTAILPRVKDLSGGTEFRFSRNLTRTDLRMTVQVAENLAGTWTDAAESVAGGPVTSLIVGVSVTEAGVNPVKEVTLVETLIPGLQRRFLRLRVEVTP